jgi:hypothetical protein
MPAEGRDPSGYVSGTPSVVVKVVETARNDINGLLGIVISYNLERERYLVHMTQSQSTMALRKENLAKANMMESYRAQWQQLQNDPRVREKMAHYVTLCQQYVSPMQLSHVVGSVVTGLTALLYLVGLTKTIMTTSLLVLMIVIAGPDLLNKSPPQVIFQHFPARARQTMEQQMPILRGKLSNRIALGVMMFLVALCLQSLVLGGRFKGPPGPVLPLLDRPSLEKYYDMGFEDATKDHTHGHSLKEELASLNMLDEDPLDASDDAEGGKKKPTFLAKLCNLTNVISMFFLYRSIADLGTDQSTDLFSIGQLAANMQHHTEWWRKALLVLSLYNFLRIFL